MICKDCNKNIDGQFMHFYMAKTDSWYCYDCYQKRRRTKKENPKKKRDSLTHMVHKLHAAKWKPSEIANELNITTKEVYERLNEQ